MGERIHGKKMVKKFWSKENFCQRKFWLKKTFLNKIFLVKNNFDKNFCKKYFC